MLFGCPVSTLRSGFAMVGTVLEICGSRAERLDYVKYDSILRRQSNNLRLRRWALPAHSLVENPQSAENRVISESGPTLCYQFGAVTNVICCLSPPIWPEHTTVAVGRKVKVVELRAFPLPSSPVECRACFASRTSSLNPESCEITLLR
jgi:hypothetical protein